MVIILFQSAKIQKEFKINLESVIELSRSLNTPPVVINSKNLKLAQDLSYP